MVRNTQLPSDPSFGNFQATRGGLESSCLWVRQPAHPWILSISLDSFVHSTALLEPSKIPSSMFHSQMKYPSVLVHLTFLTISTRCFVLQQTCYYHSHQCIYTCRPYYRNTFKLLNPLNTSLRVKSTYKLIKGTSLLFWTSPISQRHLLVLQEHLLLLGTLLPQIILVTLLIPFSLTTSATRYLCMCDTITGPYSLSPWWFWVDLLSIQYSPFLIGRLYQSTWNRWSREGSQFRVQKFFPMSHASLYSSYWTDFASDNYVEDDYRVEFSSHCSFLFLFKTPLLFQFSYPTLSNRLQISSL